MCWTLRQRGSGQSRTQIRTDLSGDAIVVDPSFAAVPEPLNAMIVPIGLLAIGLFRLRKPQDA